MRSLFKLFRRIILKITGIYTIGSIIGILALDRLFGGYEFYLGTLVFIAPVLAWAETFMLVPKNLDWLMSLPISKRNILVLHYGTSIFASVMVLLATVFVLIVLTLIKTDTHISHVSIGGFIHKAPALVPESKVGATMEGVDIYGWMLVLLMLSFYHALSMSISRPASTKRLYWNLWNHSNVAVRWAIRTGWIALIALAAIFREYFLAPFGIFVVTTFVFLFLTTFNTTHALGISHGQRRRWMISSAVVASVQIAFLFAHAEIGMRASSFDRRVASVMFLGPLSGGISKVDLEHLLEADLSSERIQELGEHYKKTYSAGKKIRTSQVPSLKLVDLLAKKKSYGAVINTVNLFDPSDFVYADLVAIFSKLQPLMAECHCDFPGYELLAAKLHWSEAIKLLESRDDLAVNFGLLWSRYRGKPMDAALVPVVQRGLPNYSDKAKLAALKTLGVLHGRRFSFNDWISERTSVKGRAVSSTVFDVSCSEWSPKPVTEITVEDAPALNYCIRQKADIAYVGEIEALGWIEPPFDLRARTVIRRIFKVK